MIGIDGKVNVKGILIRRQDGSLRGPYEVVLGTWEETDTILRLWAKSAPSDGSYESCHFRVVFEDGNSYSGTFQLRQKDSFGRNLLSNHIRSICSETEHVWDAKSFLERYDIPKAA